VDSPSFSIRSSSTAKELRFLNAANFCFSVELRGAEIYAVREVYCPPGSTDFAGFFARLASHERPWDGVQSCESLEGELALSAQCSPLGVVTFSVRIRGQIGVQEEWQLTSDLVSDLGGLPRIAAAAGHFFDLVEHG
jgi:hypothetical protein